MAFGSSGAVQMGLTAANLIDEAEDITVECGYGRAVAPFRSSITS